MRRVRNLFSVAAVVGILALLAPGALASGPRLTVPQAQLEGALRCPIDPTSFASKLVPNIHVIGDACIAGQIPKAASAASAQGKACAAGIVAMISGKAPESPRLSGACYKRSDGSARVQAWRTGCEGRISVLKRRHALNRCRYRGDAGMKRWVGLG